VAIGGHQTDSSAARGPYLYTKLERIVNNAQTPFGMSSLGLRSPFAKINGFVYFGRMLDKIRMHAKGELPEDYQANLGKGFDDWRMC